MRTHRHRWGRRSRRAPTRLVTESWGTDLSKVYLYSTGLWAVRRMRLDFPEFYREHVAHLRLDFVMLARAGEAWMRLVNLHIIQLDEGMYEYVDVDGDPLAALAHISIEDEGESFLAELFDSSLAGCLQHPYPTLWGRNKELRGEEWNGSNDLLEIALWWLVSLTDVAMHAEHDIIDWMEGVEYEQAKRIRKIKRLPATTNLFDLASVLDAAPVSETFGVPLGAMLRYITGQTDNFFANMHWDEADEMDWSYDWDGDSDVKPIDDQREAKLLHDQYEMLSSRVELKPALLTTLVNSIWGVFATAQSDRSTGKTLVEILGDFDDIDENEIQDEGDGQTTLQALAA